MFIESMNTIYTPILKRRVISSYLPLFILKWIFPRILASIAEDFSLESTKLNNDKSKAGTGRRSLGGVIDDQVCDPFIFYFSSKSHQDTILKGA